MRRCQSVRWLPPLPKAPQPPPRDRDPLRGSVDDYRPVGRRQRRLLWVLGLCTALFIFFMMIERPGAKPPNWLHLLTPVEGTAAPGNAAPPAAAPCAPGQTRGCVGGRTELIRVVPAN
jgi:hypothetical protein